MESLTATVAESDDEDRVHWMLLPLVYVSASPLLCLTLQSACRLSEFRFLAVCLSVSLSSLLGEAGAAARPARQSEQDLDWMEDRQD